MPTDSKTNGADVARRLRRFAVASLFACMMAPATAQSFEVMTLNIRLDVASDGPNAWDERKADMAFFVSSRHPDFFCLQEGLIQQLRYLDGQMPSYRRIGVGRDDGADKGEFSAVYFDTTRFALVRTTTFWLSDTPDTVSVGWDAALPRVCTYGLFRDRTSGKLVHLFNTHFDHMGVVAREKSAILILDRIAEWTTDDERVILTGDLNCAPKDRPIAIIRDRLIDGADIAPYGLVGPQGTWNGFDPAVTPDHRIDYIFVRNLEVVTYRHLDDRRKNGLRISDHLPVRATLKM
jgi:endonuclease/exonuclease/phosphatase family metal-dependent hydrolase